MAAISMRFMMSWGMASVLFTPLSIRGVMLRNRIVVPPKCEYSSPNGYATDWHLVHLGSRAVGGAGAVLTEAAAVTQDGRISQRDLGIYLDDHVEALARILSLIHISEPTRLLSISY